MNLPCVAFFAIMLFAQLNARSINTSFQLVERIIQQKGIDVLLITEIWHPNFSKATFLKNWRWFTSERQNRQGGGAAIVVNSNVKAIERKDLQNKDKFESAWSDVYIGEKKYLVCSAYIPPKCRNDMKFFLEQVKDVAAQTDRLVVTGDLNARHPFWYNTNTNALGDQLYLHVNDLDPQILNDRSFTYKKSVIDLTLAYNQCKNEIKNWKVNLEAFINSDHRLITFAIGVAEPIIRETRWNFKNVDWKEWEEKTNIAFSEWIRNINWDLTQDCDVLHESLCERMQRVAEAVIKKKTVCKYSKGFFNQEIKNAISEVRKAKRTFNVRSSPRNFDAFLESKDHLCNLLRKEATEYWDKLIRDLDIRDPKKFWKTHAAHTNNNKKFVIQPIVRSDGTVASSDKEIAQEMMNTYGRENLDVSSQTRWYNEIESEAKQIVERETNKIKDQNYIPTRDNTDFSLSEVDAAIDCICDDTAPNPDENINPQMIKRAGTEFRTALLRLFQLCWCQGKFPNKFKEDHKNPIPKPDKDNYNITKAYRPITLGALIGKVMERIANGRLIWKAEVDSLFDPLQDAYRKMHMCTNTVLRLTQSVHNAWNADNIVGVVVMDYESCYERIWRAGLIVKLDKAGIGGRLLVYVANFISDRKFRFRVNDFITDWQASGVGIPQGQVISPTLCNLYTADSMQGVASDHFSFADDNALWRAGDNTNTFQNELQRDVDLIADRWCRKWNMLISAQKTEVMVFAPKGKPATNQLEIRIDGVKLKVVPVKRVLGVWLDCNLTFSKHIEKVANGAYGSLKTIKDLSTPLKSCRMSACLQLYKSLIVTRFEFACTSTITASSEITSCFQSIQRKVLICATGCLNSASSTAVEALTNTPPIDVHLSMRQAQEVVRICASAQDTPIKVMFQEWLQNRRSEKHVSPFALMYSRFRELKGDIDLQNIEEDHLYDTNIMHFAQTDKYFDKKDWSDKESQKIKILTTLQHMEENHKIAFTDGSAFKDSNNRPGPVGCAAVIYCEGLNSTPVCLSRYVTSKGNNYTGELAGILLCLDHASEYLKDCTLDIFCDCQPAIFSSFSDSPPDNNFSLVFKIRDLLAICKQRGVFIAPHWVPGHVGIEGNELADRLAKKAASNATQPIPYCQQVSKKHCFTSIKNQALDRWQRRYNLANDARFLHEVMPMVGARKFWGEANTTAFNIFNQILSGHSNLNAHKYARRESESNKCPHCDQPETTEHYILQCSKYTMARFTLVNNIESSLFKNALLNICPTVKLITILGFSMLPINVNRQVVLYFLNYIRDTGRFKHT